MAQGRLTTLTLLILSGIVNLNECFRHRRDVEEFMSSHLAVYELVHSSNVSVSVSSADSLNFQLHTQAWYCCKHDSCI